VKNVGRPLVGLQGNNINNHHFRNVESQWFSFISSFSIVGFFILTALETHQGPPYIFHITAILAKEKIKFKKLISIEVGPSDQPLFVYISNLNFFIQQIY